MVLHELPIHIYHPLRLYSRIIGVKRYFAGIIFAVLFFIVGVLTLSDYGMHEDNPFHFLRGQYYLNRILGSDGTFAIPPLRSPVLFL